MADGNTFDFRELVERYADADEVKQLTFTLLSGDKYVLQSSDQVTFYKYVVVLAPREGGENLFPFEAVCNVDVEFKSEE